jgi:NAD(P)H-flavin reductase
MMSISAWFRHGDGKRWEYFKYLHFVFLVLVPATLYHAASAWYFLLGGIAFYLIDASIRFVGTVSPPAKLLEVGVSQADTGFTLLTFDRIHEEPGQFAWIRVPAISDWEWHPFSISSAPSDGRAKMCIKNMGPGTWTDQLFKLAEEAEGSEDPWPVQLDGFYGPPLLPMLADHAGALLLAGGVGITQPHSVFRELAAFYMENQALPGSLKFVKLIWVARNEKILDIFSSSISDCLAEIPESVMSAEFYANVKAESAVGNSEMSILVKEGIPSFEDLYIAGSRALTEEETLFVQACGPPVMVDAAASAAAKHPSVTFDSALFVL